MTTQENLTVSQPSFVAENAASTRLSQKLRKKEQKALASLLAILKLLESEVSKAKSETASSGDEKVVDIHSGQASDAGDGDSLFQISAGPAALAQAMIYEIMQLFNEVIQLDKEQKVQSLKDQELEAQGQANAMEAGGKAAMDAAITAGALVVAGALLSVAAIGYGSYKARQENAELSEVETEMKPMNLVDKSSKEITPEDHKISPKDKEVVSKLAKQLKDHNYVEAAKDPAKTKEALQYMKEQDVNSKKPGADKTEGWENFDYGEWKAQFDKNLNRLTTQANTKAQRANEMTTKYNTGSQIVSGVLNNLSGTAQGIGQYEKAKQDASAALLATDSQSSGAVVSDTQQAMAKAASLLSDEVKILEKLGNLGTSQGS